MAQAGNSMSETLALVTAGTEVMTGQASRVARGLRSITLNLQGMDDAGNQDLELTAKMEGAFNKLGITLMDSNGQMKSTYQILSELAAVYPNLDQNTKNYYASLIGGKTQVDVVNSVLTNFQTAIDANAAALDSAGSAAKENDVYLQSLQGRLGQLKSAWQELAHATIDSDFVKWVLELTTNLIKLADSGFGKFIVTLVAAKAGMVAFNKVLKTNAIISLGASIKTGLINYLSALIIQFNAASISGGTFAGVMSSVGLSVKALGSVLLSLLTNPIVLAIAAVGGLTLAFDKMKKTMEEASEGQQKIAENNLSQANAIQQLANQYEELSNKTERTKAEEKELSTIIDTLSDKYGISKEALESEGKERDKAIKQLDEEIKKRKQAAAIAESSSLKVSKSKIGVVFGGGDTTQAEKETFASRDAVNYGGSGDAKDLSKRYDLEAESVSKLQEKIKGYIETLQNTSDKSKEQEEDLTKLSKLYNEMTSKIDTYKNAYNQAYENFKEGIPITTEQGNVLYQLGELTRNQALAVEAYNKYIIEHNDLTDEQKEKVWEIVQAKASEVDADNNIIESTQAVNSALTDEEKAAQAAQTKLNSLNSTIDTMQKSMNILKSAVDEYNSNGYISIDTLQSLLSLNSDYLSLLEMQDGQLILNTESIDNMANALVNQKQEELQAAAIADIWAIAQEGASKSSDTAAKSAEDAGKTAGASGDDAAKGINGWLQYAAAVDTAAEAAGKTVDDEETKKRIQERVEQYKAAAKTISQLGASFGSGGYSTDTTHKYKGSGSNSSGSKSSSSSTKEEYKATIDTLYSYTNALEIAKDAVDKLQDALENTDNYEEQEKYIKQLISALNDEINKTNELKAAQTSQINDYINQLRAQGFAIDYNSSKNTLYINNMQHLADFSGDTAKSLEKMIDKIQDLNKDNIKLDSSVRDLVKDTKDYNEELENLPTEKLKKFKELLEDFQQGRLDQIQNQIDDIQHEMENDPRIKALEKQIEALEEQNDALDKQEDLEEKILAVEEAKEKLANAQRQRNVQIYTESGLS